MGVYIKGVKMPKECGECRWFHFHGETCTTPKYYLDARCELVKSGQDWYGKDSRGGWVGKSISHLPGYGDYYSHEHCVEIGTRALSCPLVKVKEPHGDLIDRDALSDAVLKWMPHDPCGDPDKERPFETDICASMMMEIEDQDAVVEAEDE